MSNGVSEELLGLVSDSRFLELFPGFSFELPAGISDDIVMRWRGGF